MPKRKYGQTSRQYHGGAYKRARYGSGPGYTRRFRAAPNRRGQGYNFNQRTGGFRGIELKFYDTFLLDSTLTSPTDSSGGEHDPSATILFNTVTQGDGENQRDGRKLTMKALTIRGHINVALAINQTAMHVQPTFMIALVLDTQTNGATIVSENVFANIGANGATAPYAFRNLQFAKRFKILKIKRFSGRQQETSYDGTNMEMGGYTVPFDMYVNLKNMQVLYSGTTETVANITDNSLHLIAFTSETSSQASISYIARLRFVG